MQNPSDGGTQPEDEGQEKNYKDRPHPVSLDFVSSTRASIRASEKALSYLARRELSMQGENSAREQTL